MRLPLLTTLVVTLAAGAAAQTPGGGLLTASGQEVSGSVGYYTYVEPAPLRISISGPRFGVEYTGVRALRSRPGWFVTANARASGGHVAYDGWCRPWLLRPAAASPNGYGLGLGDAFTCSESGDLDGYVDGRGLIGRDLVFGGWALAPEAGVGVRYLSDGVTGVVNFRTDTYLYVPLRASVRTAGAARWLRLTGEYDILLRGWQQTRQSRLGGGTIPAAGPAPAFTIDGFTDMAFEQHRGWALRAGAGIRVSRRWSIDPAYSYWHVASSPVSRSTVTFTVGGVTAVQELGAYEPDNVTHEAHVALGFHF